MLMFYTDVKFMQTDVSKWDTSSLCSLPFTKRHSLIINVGIQGILYPEF